MNVAGVDVPNTVDEMTVGLYDKHVALEMNPNLTTLEKWIEKFVVLGVPEESFDEFTFDEMTETITKFNEGFDLNTPKVLEVEIEGYTYKAKESVTVKDMSLIEKLFNGDKKDLVANTVAILFKREDLSRNEHYDKAHLDHKAKLFKDQSCSIAIPFMQDILKTILESVDEVSE